MRVRLVKEKTIHNFTIRHASGRNAFRTWLNVIKSVNWTIPGDIKDTFGSADLLGDGYRRVVFDIGGNKYRVICGYLFGKKEVHLFVCWIGTHAEYTELCKKGGQYTISMF
jgi:mRNA interferase HigB